MSLFDIMKENSADFVKYPPTHSSQPSLPLSPPSLIPISALPRSYTDVYRTASNNLAEEKENEYLKLLPLAREYSEKHGISLNDAIAKLNPNERMDQWDRISIEEPDLKVGVKLKCHNPIITCNTQQRSGMYYDTIALIFLGKSHLGSLTYNNQTFKVNSCYPGVHSGDLHPMPSWLRHVITFDYDVLRKLHDPASGKDLKIYIVSAGWNARQPQKLSEYVPLTPVIEVRTENSTSSEMKRYVIAQGIAEALDNTSIISVCIKPSDDNLWETTIVEEFSLGFADGIEPILNKIREGLQHN